MMNPGKRFLFFNLIILLGFVAQSCVEEVPVAEDIKSKVSIEDILIVEATITDEFKSQEILLSRGSGFSGESVDNFERNATVRVFDELGNTYIFEEQSPGQYISQSPFSAQQGIDYQLSVITQDGVEYQSETNRLNGTSNIEDIYAERIISDNGVEGMAIFVDSSNPEGDLNDYRYTYEETYKIIAPNWTEFEFEILSEGEVLVDDTTGEVEIIYPDVALVPRAQEEQTCYNTVSSREIILSDGLLVEGTELKRNLIRFIGRDDAIISHRYSILVRQLLQSVEAAKFYRTLLQFSQNQSLFSEVQPGLIEGNITSVSDENAVAIGLFNVASITERRLFFDYEDFFPGEALPPYFGTVNCERYIAPILGNPERDGPIPPNESCGESLVDLIKGEQIEFIESTVPGECEGPYLVTQRACGDCTALGSNVVPEFWVDE
ncbi:DUF4249 domain-containing protein [Robiginitalea marina]|uniref:DUF4249 domain-containing protein n=1 Tax=Robiginitalea marina TaxID=2954105 RepID=A0ABT1AYG2_9FLAO|nr:DUF4249 domain-containing protein [Robiginitalea marina]MCO5725074.1 DUF4249 domain-containing protein [Robiginitalea marina]